jgi:hypothetical protein
MDDLRAEIREAFEREQAGQVPDRSLLHAMTPVATAHPRRAPNLQWLAVAAAVVLGIAIVAGLLSTRLANRNVPAHPKATPSPLIDYGPPPAGAALIYVADAKHPGWYNAFDWTGRPRGTIKLAAPIDDHLYLTQAPDGSGFIASLEKNASLQSFDRLGTPIPEDPSLLLHSQVWADDSRHLCTLDYNSFQWHIGLRAPGAAPTSLRTVAIDPSVVQSGIIALDFSSCSPSNDRAVLVYNYFGRPAQYWVVRLSDGTILSHQTFPANVLSETIIYGAPQLAGIVASPDGTLVAENSAGASGSLLGGAAPSTTIRRTSGGSTVLSLDPTFGVIAFSRDDSVALVSTSPWAAGVPTQLAVINIQTGTVIWRSGGQDKLTAVQEQPDGTAFALFLQDAHDTNLHPTVHVLIVQATGATIAIPGVFSQP